MVVTRTITVEVSARTLEGARREGASDQETLIEALRYFAHQRASERLLELEGKVQFGMTWQELRGKDDD